MPLLPFLNVKNRNQGGVSTEYRKPDESSEKSDGGLEACAADILRAINENNSKALAGAIQAAYDVCSSAQESQDPEITEEGLD